MTVKDNGGRRSGYDRRLSSLAQHSERRSGKDRRGGPDRRSGIERRSTKGFRRLIGLDRRRWFQAVLK